MDKVWYIHTESQKHYSEKKKLQRRRLPTKRKNYNDKKQLSGCHGERKMEEV